MDCSIKLGELLNAGFVNKDTDIFISSDNFSILAHGNFYSSCFMNCEVESVNWYESNKVAIDVKTNLIKNVNEN